MPPTFLLADPIIHRESLIELNIEYMTWVKAGIEKFFGLPGSELLGMSVPEYVAATIDKACGDAPPTGAFYLLYHRNQLAGMGGLRRIREGVGEIKRIYVRPAHRGERLGEAMLQRLKDDAIAFGYHSIILDSAPFMTSAHRLYQAAGFKDCPPYPETEASPTLHHAWRFMKAEL